MPIWYSRQSSAEIVNGQVINDSDFNNEYDAIVSGIGSAFSATLGHNHTGTYGQGPLIAITGTLGVTGITGILAAQYGGIKYSTSDPAVTDGGSTYALGSLWFNTSSLELFQCKDNTASNARWTRLYVHVTAGDPSVTDAGTQGYLPGNFWINSSTRQIWQNITNAGGTSLWVRRVGTSSASLPTVNDAVTQGYVPGHLWNYTGLSPAVPYLCTDNTPGAAVWIPIQRGTLHTSVGTDPGTTNDSTQGYEKGSIWVRTGTYSFAYIASDVTANAAVWNPLAIGRLNGTTTAPTVTDDVSKGYRVGSMWINTSTSNAYICKDATVGAAVWTNLTPSGRINPVSLFLGLL